MPLLLNEDDTIFFLLNVTTPCAENVTLIKILHILKREKSTFGWNSKIPGIPSHYLHPCSSRRKCPTVKVKGTHNRVLGAQDACLASVTLLLLHDTKEKMTALLFTCVSSDDWCVWGVTSLRFTRHPEWRSFTEFHLNRIAVTHLKGLWEKQHSKQVLLARTC